MKLLRLAAEFFGVPRWLAIFASLGLVAGGCALLVRCHDAKVIERHDDARGAEQARAVSEADRTAIANDSKRAQVRAADSQKTREAIDHAEAIDPEAVRRPAGPAVRSAVDSLRDRTRGTGDTAH